MSAFGGDGGADYTCIMPAAAAASDFRPFSDEVSHASRPSRRHSRRRTHPFCRQNTAYADVGNLGMSVRTLGALVERFGLHGQQLGEVAMGAVIKHSSDWNLGREAALSSGLSPLTPGITLQRACGTSLDSIITVANKIALGQIDSGIGGGSDTTSDVPIVYGKLRARVLAANRGKTPRTSSRRC